MQSHQLLFFSPSQSVTEILYSNQDKCKDYLFDIIPESSLSSDVEFIKVKKQILETDYSGVIICGYRSKEAAQDCLVPVFELNLSDYDILAAASLAVNYIGNQIMLVESQLEQHILHLFLLLNFTIPVCPICAGTDISNTLDELCKKGYTLFIADSSAYSACQNANLSSIFMSPGYQSVLSLIQQIQAFFEQKEITAARANIFKGYFTAANQSFLIYNSKKELFDSINLPNDPKLLSVAFSLVDEVIQHKELQQIRPVNSKIYYIKGKLISNQEQSYIVFEIKQSFEDKRTSIPGVIMKNKDNLSKDFYNMFYDDLKNMDFRNKVIAYSSSQNPIVIIGESGTGKSRLADFIYTHSPYTQSSLFLIDCKQLDKRGLNHLFNSDNSPLYEYGITLYFKEINLLKKKYTDELINFLIQSAFMKKSKVIFSVTCSIDNSDTDPLCMQLISKLNTFPLYLLPLRNRMNDIPNLAILYINQLNERYHKHIAGFEPEAMNYLQSFYWDENIKQFKRILEELFVMTTDPYISARKVISVLSEKKAASDYMSPDVQTEAMTLDEIVQKGVRKSLMANHMNQTKAAQELGISRTSLWRLLKKF